MSSVLDRVLDAERRADIARWDEFERRGVNLPAIVAAREGLTGEAQAEHAIAKCEREASAYLSGDTRESAKVARLHFEIGMLRGELRRVCGAYEAVVEPLQ
jgi:hypothetical protein